MSDTTNVKSPKEKYKCKISDFDVIKFLLNVLDEEHLGLKKEIIKTLKDEYGFDYKRRNIENSTYFKEITENVKVDKSGVCRVSNSVAKLDGKHIIWYKVGDENYKITEAFADERGIFAMFKIDKCSFNIIKVIYFTNVKPECHLCSCLIEGTKL